MLKEETHISNEDLLQAADGELGTRRAAQVHAHLAACWICRARMAEIEGAITGFVRAHRDTRDLPLPPADGPRALLRAQLAQLAHPSVTHTVGHSRQRWPWINAARMAAVCAAAVAAVLFGGFAFLHRVPHSPAASSAALEREALPERDFTPGATRNVSMSEICSIPHEEVVREVSDSTRKKVFNEYGMRNARAEDFEIDYLIAPRLGGTDDIRNLWPQPFKSAKWNATVKDELEERLHQMVCSGDLDLPTAQHEIAHDWIAAYKKYFHTDAPLSSHARMDAWAPSDPAKYGWSGHMQSRRFEQSNDNIPAAPNEALRSFAISLQPL